MRIQMLDAQFWCTIVIKCPEKSPNFNSDVICEKATHGTTTTNNNNHHHHRKIAIKCNYVILYTTHLYYKNALFIWNSWMYCMNKFVLTAESKLHPNGFLRLTQTTRYTQVLCKQNDFASTLFGWILRYQYATN